MCVTSNNVRLRSFFHWFLLNFSKPKQWCSPVFRPVLFLDSLARWPHPQWGHNGLYITQTLQSSLLYLRILPKYTAGNLTGFFGLWNRHLTTIISMSRKWTSGLTPLTGSPFSHQPRSSCSLQCLSNCPFHLLTTGSQSPVLTHSRNSANICWENEWINEWVNCYIIHC